MKRILYKIKAALKKAIKLVFSKAHATVTKISMPVKRKPEVKRVPVEAGVGASKFYIPAQIEKEKRVYPVPSELPSGYLQDRVVLQVRDPWWIHAYWEITDSTWERLRREFPTEMTGGFRRVLRVYDVSNIIFTGNNAHRLFDIEITSDANNWYIDTQEPGRSWCVDFGVIFSNGKFITLIRSNTVSTPPAGPSWITDEEWIIPEDVFARLYGLGVGIGSSPVSFKRLWQERLKGAFGSGGLFSAVSPVKKEKPKGFWLVANTELIVYGQTQPDAKLNVCGFPVKLKSDGSFSLRFFLPDGKQTIPVVATSSDGEQIRSITPVVTKETK